MKNIFKLLIFIFLSFSLLEAKWRDLEDLSEYYNKNDFSFKEGIKYLEIRAYATTDKGQKKPSRVLFSSSQSVYQGLNKTLRKYFASLEPIAKSGSDLHLERGYFSDCTLVYNAFVITDDDKIYKMNMKEDILSFLGEIDTDGEFALMLWLDDPRHGIQTYRKTSKGFEAIQWDRPMVDINKKCIDRKYKLSFDKKVRLLTKKRMKTVKTQRDCLDCILEAPSVCR